jgi:nitrous oxide reductase accessory protein NosL
MFLLWLPIAEATDLKTFMPTKSDKCPVCGMFVAKYPDWLAEVVFKDGSVAFFDGAKDLYKYYLNLKKYEPKKTQADVVGIFVTEYYGTKLIDGTKAYYVIGSDVYGPMGRELIPFLTEADAKEFMADHGGKRLLKFNDIKPVVIDKLDH